MKRVQTLQQPALMSLATLMQTNVASAQTKAVTTQHLKKDGIPDKRYKNTKHQKEL